MPQWVVIMVFSITFIDYPFNLFLFFCCIQVLLKTFGVKIVVSGDHVIHDDSAILMMNHRTRTDWNFVWAAMYQACMPNVAAHRLKMILKDPVRHVPGPGTFSFYSFILILHLENDIVESDRKLNFLIS